MHILMKSLAVVSPTPPFSYSPSKFKLIVDFFAVTSSTTGFGILIQEKCFVPIFCSERDKG